MMVLMIHTDMVLFICLFFGVDYIFITEKRGWVSFLLVFFFVCGGGWGGGVN